MEKSRNWVESVDVGTLQNFVEWKSCCGLSGSSMVAVVVKTKGWCCWLVEINVWEPLSAWDIETTAGLSSVIGLKGVKDLLKDTWGDLIDSQMARLLLFCVHLSIVSLHNG